MGDPILSLVRTTSAALLSLLIELQGSTMDFMILNLFGSVVETRSYNRYYDLQHSKQQLRHLSLTFEFSSIPDRTRNGRETFLDNLFSYRYRTGL